ncbi:MAG: hypothetical protein ARM1_0764 [Candidatus Micrarchaeota archaeon]|nr:MAG: hypothetical protein ARM1_0764 [Candidatus Micrarchaeota archaeon]
MTEIYIIPIGSKEPVENMNRTLINKVSKKEVEEHHVSLESLGIMDDSVNIWGLIPGKKNNKKWSRYNNGDYVIFVPTRYPLIVAQIIGKTDSKDLAEYLWGRNKNGATWEHIFFLKIISFLEKEKREFLRELGYRDKDVLKDNRRITERFIKVYGSIDNFLSKNYEDKVSEEEISNDLTESLIESIYSKEDNKKALVELEKIIEESEKKPADYIEVRGRRFKRKQLFVVYVRMRDNYRCRACGFNFIKKDGKPYVEVAHIVPLYKGGLDHPSNMVALCPNCHKKLDKGDDKARQEVLEALKNAGAIKV